MRRILTAIAGVAVVLIAAGGVAAAHASSSDATGRTITVVQRAPAQAFDDLDEDGVPSPGDILVFRSSLFDPTNTNQVGDLHIHCVVNFGGKAVCMGIFTLTGRGQLAVDALPEFPNAVTGIVTGGNGEFQRARGEADIEPQADGTTAITFHLFG
jgi:hypothetical protein